MKVVKRDGNIVEFEVRKIVRAIEKAMMETTSGIDETLCNTIGEKIEMTAEERETPISVDEIQDLVEDLLMGSPRKDAAKKYIIYRSEKDRTRTARKREDNRLLTDEFISKYKHMDSPMQQLGDFVYYRTYSRWLPEEKRREYWWETVRRAVEYNCAIVVHFGWVEPLWQSIIQWPITIVVFRLLTVSMPLKTFSIC
jgi:ribonucleoside-diphosphate reductase alpha chain/ribonucleoside-triphosphate reductase